MVSHTAWARMGPARAHAPRETISEINLFLKKKKLYEPTMCQPTICQHPILSSIRKIFPKDIRDITYISYLHARKTHNHTSKELSH